MKYETARKEFYENEIHNMAAQVARILDEGYSVEIGRSRHGLKLFTVSRKHEVRRKGNCNNNE